MKKRIFAILAICIGLLGLFAGCKDKTTSMEGTAYGLVHNANYIGMAKLVIDNSGKITDAYLDEACLPHYVKAETTVASEDMIEVGDNRYFKTVKYNKVTMTFDQEKNTYLIDGQDMKEYYKDESKAKEYYLAVEQNILLVTLNGNDTKDVLTADKLMKSRNGYWKEGTFGKGWKANRDATINYVKANGLSNLPLEKGNSGAWIDSKGIDTGATWVDMSGTKEGFVSYLDLLKKANNAIKK